MKEYKVKVYKNLDENLVRMWKGLWLRSKSANFFNSYEFCAACMKTYSDDNYEIFCLEKEEEAVAILPLVKSRVFGFTCYVNPGGRFVEKSPILVKDASIDNLKYLLDFIVNRDNLRLSELPEDIAKYLNTSFKKSLVSIISINPFIDLKQEKYFGLNKKTLSKLENRFRKNKDSLEYLHITKGGEKELNSVIDLEKRSTKSTMGKGIFGVTSSRLFFRNLIKICNNRIVFDYLTFNKKIFVSAVGVIFKDTYYAYHTSYLRDYKYFVPGKMITYFMLSQLKSEGVKLFDFTRGYSDFKKEFTENFSLQYDFYLSKSNFINLWWKLINLARRVKIVLFKTKYYHDHFYLFKTV